MDDFLIGQRVIFSGTQIVIIISCPRNQTISKGEQWIRLVNETEWCVSLDNLKPLPGGQL